MSSFQISVTPSRRVAARFIAHVRREIQKALAEEGARKGLTQSDLARGIGVHRSVISRELRGYKDLTLGRVGELAHALGREPTFSLQAPQADWSSNIEASEPNIHTAASSNTVLMHFNDFPQKAA